MVPNGVWLPDAAAVQETAEMLEIAERSGDDLTLAYARYVHGVALLTYDGAPREDAFTLLAAAVKPLCKSASRWARRAGKPF